MTRNLPYFVQKQKGRHPGGGDGLRKNPGTL